RRGPDEGEAGDVEAQGPRGWTLAEDDVDLEVLHRRVEDLLAGAGEPVDPVDAEDVALLELGEDRGEVAGALQSRTRGDVQPDAHLRGHDAGQGRLPQTWWTGEEQVVGRLPAAAGRLEHDAEVVLQLRLTHELREGAR